MNAKWLGVVLFSCWLVPAREVRVTVGPRGEVKTVEEGLGRVRTMRKVGDTGRLLISGTHYLAKPILLTEADSGTTFQGAGKGAVLSGGRILSGWKKGPRNLWELEIPEVKSGQWYFRQLFVNGERRTRARTPNSGYLRVDGASPEMTFKFKPGDIKKSWAAPGDVEVVSFIGWADTRIYIRDVDETSHQVTMSSKPLPYYKEPNAKYYVENAEEFLDSPGEWYLNRKTGILRYWPMSGETMARARVIAPILHDLVKISGNGTSKKAAENIKFRGITFAYTDYTVPTNGYADVQASFAAHGDVSFEFAKDCTIDNCVFTGLAGYAVELSRGAQRIKVRNCEIVDVGAGGLRIGEGEVRKDAFDEVHSNQVSDCHIHRLGQVFASGVGVFILQSATNLISHNEIDHTYYSGISVGWNWGYHASPVRNNIIEYNHIHDIGQGLLCDMGGVYTLGVQPGTIVRNNLIHDVNASVYGGWGLYTDEGSASIVMENNIVYRCQSAGFHQHYGRENIIRNNVFAFGKERQLMRTREEQHSSFTFENNIVYYDSGDLLESKWSNDKFVMDRNVYFDARPGAKVTFGGAPLNKWQERGHDKNSVMADPLFADAQKNDYRLRRESPALKLGFKQIDLSTVGPRGKVR